MVRDKFDRPRNGIASGTYIIIYEGGSPITSDSEGLACCKMRWTPERLFLRDIEEPEFTRSFPPASKCADICPPYVAFTPERVGSAMSCTMGAPNACFDDDGVSCNVYSDTDWVDLEACNVDPSPQCADLCENYSDWFTDYSSIPYEGNCEYGKEYTCANNTSQCFQYSPDEFTSLKQCSPACLDVCNDFVSFGPAVVDISVCEAEGFNNTCSHNGACQQFTDASWALFEGCVVIDSCAAQCSNYLDFSFTVIDNSECLSGAEGTCLDTAGAAARCLQYYQFDFIGCVATT